MIVKLSRIAFMVLSVVSIFSVGCATVPAHKSVTAKDGSSVLVPANSSASGYPSIVRDLRRVTWEAGPELYYFKYKEAGFMEEEGTFYGAHVGFTLRNWLPNSPEQSSEAMDIAFYKWMLRGEGRFALGEVDYDGGIGSTPLTINNLDDRTFGVRLLTGPDFVTENTIFTLFTGIGYRYLHDDLRTSSVDIAGPLFGGGGYERESQYLYLPLGAQMTSQLGGGWFWGASAELDILIWGNQRSHIPIILVEEDPDNPGTLIPVVPAEGWDFTDNYQPRGYGLRGSVRLEKKGDTIDLIIEPFVRYWDINESDLDFSITGLEPTNSTLEAGVRVMLGF